MVKVKKNSVADVKKKGFSKNSSFSGVEAKKSPQSRRKSIAAFAVTPENPNISLKKARKSISKPEKVAKKHVPLVLAPTPETKSLSSVKKKSTRLTKPQEARLEFTEYEENFQIKASDIINAIEGIKKYASESPKFQKQLFNEQIPLMLQVNSVKVPKGHKKVFRIPLKNPILTKEDDVCLIVPDVKGIPNKEHERHVEHYKKLLADKKVTGIKKIMTFHEFRTEYETFELKNRLVDLYEAFLVDGKISGKVVQKGGKIFYKKRKLPTPIKLQATKLKENINSALHKTFFDVHLKSNSYIVQFGHSNMEIPQLIENVYSVAKFLREHFPGGLDNVQNMYITSAKTVAVPIYISLKNPNEIPVPKIVTKKPKAYKTYKGELTTQLAAKVTVKPSGEVIVTRKRQKNKLSENKDEITDQDILKVNKEETKEIKTEEKSVKKSRKRKQDIEKNHIKDESVGGKKIKKEKKTSGKQENIKQENTKPISKQDKTITKKKLTETEKARKTVKQKQRKNKQKLAKKEKLTTKLKPRQKQFKKKK